ncbi:DUF6090 family protein [Polaribacter sp. IC063]|uniref:DUF6090 family protein n=1 Tax=Polaribacter sp. IC063 TaxID=57031 RepID=UPI0011BF030E|nr:DUF6090 family protein [Polaribacter sp. IC063]TXD53085.1 hypothetical protein ES043_06015 [Polaribacter sp. IC063]
MIKFFRKIRQNLLIEEKKGKYFKYAIGEIVLVVIGILIALQINNWNEKRKVNDEIESVFSLLEQELETNIERSNYFLNYGYRRDSVQTMFNQNKVTPEMIRASPELINLNFGTHKVQFMDDRLNELISLEKQIPKRYKKLISGLKLLKSHIDSHRFWESKALSLAEKKSEEYVNKFSWYYSNDSLSFEKAIRHALTDTIYRNNVSYYTHLQLNENVFDATLMRTSSVELLWQIKSIRGLNKTQTIKQFLNELDLKPLTEYACMDKPYKKNEIFFRRNFIVYNNTKDSITFNYVDESGNREYPLTVAPNNFLPNGQIMYSNQFIELTVDYECKKVFKQNKEDYLLFE